MNDVRDFTLMRKLAETPSRRSVLRGIGGGLLAAFGVHRVTSGQKAEKVDICHLDAETDTFRLLNVNENALGGHMGHGDYEPVWEGTCNRCATFEVFVDATKHVSTYDYLPPSSLGPMAVGPFKAGDELTISATGIANNGINDSAGVYQDTGPQGRNGAESIGSLWGMMGSTPFHIGEFKEYVVPEDAMLDLYYFDVNTRDNRGGYDVTIVACR